MVVLPLTYWGDIELFARLLRGGNEAVIDLGENYIKRSPRNRTEIITANGVLSLSVPLCNANRPRTPMRDMRIDYSTRWQHQHWVAILSAYRSSSYFDMVADRIAHFYEREYRFLVDYNLEILAAEYELLDVQPDYRLSESYVEAMACDLDLRPKKRGTTFAAPQYFQLFSDRMPFVKNPSMLDLLMCEGREALDLLRRADLTAVVQP